MPGVCSHPYNVPTVWKAFEIGNTEGVNIELFDA